MSLALKVAEVYLSLNVLLAVGPFFARSWTQNARWNLTLARLTLLACVMAPLAASFLKPAHGTVLSAAAFDGAPLASSAVSPAMTQAQLSLRQAAPASSSPVDPWFMIGVLLAIGAAWHLLQLAWGAAAMHSLIHRAVVLHRFRNVQVVVSDQTAVPQSLRFWRTAYVVLPVAMIGEARAVLIAIAHECQHHRQGDCALAYGVELLRAAFFWNPLVHRWHQRLSDLQEFSCDEALVGRRRFAPHDYGRCLFDVACAAASSLAWSREFACTSAMAARERGRSQTLLLRRLEMLPAYVAAAPRLPVRSMLLALSLVAVPFAVATAARGTVAGATAETVETVDQSALDPRLQTATETEVLKVMQRFRAKSAAALIMDPASGRVLAFAEGHQQSAQESWATRPFAPASTIKPFILASAIEAGTASESSTYDCRRPLVIAGQTFRNWTDDLGAAVSATKTIASSVNVCAIQIAQDAGAPAVRATLSHFGLEPRWQDGVSSALQLARAAVGDNEMVTMPQLARAFAALANHGRMPGGSAPRVISETTAAAVRRTLQEAVSHGTGSQAALPNLTTAGKTGTSASSQEPDSGLALFAGFAPAQAPAYVALVVIEGGRNAAGEAVGGGAAAAPVFREIIKQSL